MAGSGSRRRRDKAKPQPERSEPASAASESEKPKADGAPTSKRPKARSDADTRAHFYTDLLANERRRGRDVRASSGGGAQPARRKAVPMALAHDPVFGNALKSEAAAPGEPRPDEPGRDGAKRRSQASSAAGPSPKPITTRSETVAQIGTATTFKGELAGEQNLEINGKVEGAVNVPDHQVTIGPGGVVIANILGKSVVVIGTVSGNVVASERVEVQSAGSVEGDIRAPSLVVQNGARINGTIAMEEPGAASGADPAVPARSMKKVEAASRPSDSEVA